MNVEDREVYKHAIAYVRRTKNASTHALEKGMGIPYTLAATFIVEMEDEKIISKPGADGKRKLLRPFSDEQILGAG